MTHRHVCRCGAVYFCTQEPDHCEIRQWECPKCADDDLDIYIDQLEAEQELASADSRQR